MPHFIKPCRARAVATPPSQAGWGHEIKMDGYRVQARLEDGVVTLSTRTGLDWTGRFAELVPALKALPARRAIIDGEIIVEDARGVSDFALLVAALKSRGAKRLAYVAFDLLYLDGDNLMALPLSDRKHRLEALLASRADRLRYCQHLVGDGREILHAAARLGVEGIVSKRLHDPYRPGRDDWCKTKITLTDEFVVCGFTEAASPKETVGALAVGFYDHGRLTYAGRTGTGFSRAEAAGLWQLLEQMRVVEPPVAFHDREVRWVTPRLVVQVAYAGWTADRLLRHARYQGVREDKRPAEVMSPK